MIAKLVLRLQASAFVPPALRRRMLNAIGADIHRTATVERGCLLTTARLRMGPDTLLNAQAFVDGTDWLVLEASARVAVRATIITRTHGISDDPRRRSDHAQDFVAPVRIGAGSWVGAGCTILPGVSVAGGCVVGAGSVITRDTEANGLYIGTPARRVRELEA